jgi:hypothetical protein
MSQHGQSPAGQQRHGMRIGRLPFLGALLFALLISIPGTRSFGVGMMLLLGIPIFIGWIRARKLTDGSRGLTSANAVICGLMVVVGAALSPSNPSAPIPTESAAVAVPAQAAAPPTPQTVALQAAPPADLPASHAGQPQTLTSAPRPAPTQAPQPAKAVRPAKSPPPPTKTQPQSPAVICGGDYYTNSSGNCVHRPEAAPSAPSGATAKCKDGTYSYSQHRQGTCSRHGGVANWL